MLYWVAGVSYEQGIQNPPYPFLKKREQQETELCQCYQSRDNGDTAQALSDQANQCQSNHCGCGGTEKQASG
jgi:hypothetical protein